MRVLRELRQELRGFLVGQDHGVCVLRGQRDHLPFVYRLLQEIAADSTDVFLDFPHRFDTAETYVGMIAAQIEASGREARQQPGWSMPPTCRDAERTVAARLKDTLVCARGMLPRGSDRPRLVVVLCPLEVADEQEYVALTRALIEPGGDVAPWFVRMRVFVHAPSREDRPLPRFARALAVDLSPAAMAESANLDASDLALPPTQRTQALLQAAMLDVGHQRFVRARERLDAVHAQAQSQGNPVLAALALSGLGDVERLERRGDAAIDWYERALVPASEAGAPIVLLMITRHLADLYVAAGRIAEAAVFFDGAQQLAGLIPEPESRVSALLGRGLAEQRGGAAPTTWVASLVEAAEVARDHGCDELLAGLRPRLAAGRSPALPPELRRSIDELLGGGP